MLAEGAQGEGIENDQQGQRITMLQFDLFDVKSWRNSYF